MAMATIEVWNSSDEVYDRAAGLFFESVRENPRVVWGLATGRTPVGMYRALVNKIRGAGLDVSQLTTFNLDEYLGLLPHDPRSYAAYMARHLFGPAGLPPERSHLPPSLPKHPEAAANTYETSIREAGGIDLQLLGIGPNGHIGFNEPGTPFGSRTHVVTLTPTTRQANALFFGGDLEAVPRQAITMGIATILEAHRLILVALGQPKARVLAEALTAPISPTNPASVLQRHANLMVIADRAAGSLLNWAVGV